MPQHFLNYWRWDTVQAEFASDEEVDHAASEQFSKIEIGDILWIVTVHSGQLFLVGRLQVGWRGGLEEAKQRLNTENIWQSNWHVIAQQGTKEPYKLINLSSFAPQLRFQSNASDRLTIKSGSIDSMQLRTIRLLTEESSRLLDTIWYGETLLPDNTLEFIETVEDLTVYSEGRLILRIREERQRSQALVDSAKRAFKAKHKRLYCEVCGFDFGTFYGDDLADGYIEAHHTKPISDSNEEVSTTIDGLAMLCANCHRMIHRQPQPLTIDELRQRIKVKLDQ